MSDPSTSLHGAAKRQRTDTVDFTSGSNTYTGMTPAAAAPPQPGATAPSSTLPANFNGSLRSLPDYNQAAWEHAAFKLINLPEEDATLLLAYAAARNPYIMSLADHMIEAEKARKQERERTGFIDFMPYYFKALFLLTTQYPLLKNSGSSKAHQDKAYDFVIIEVGKLFDVIMDQVRKAGGGAGCSFETRQSAVSAMVHIMDSVVNESPSDELRARTRNGAFLTWAKQQMEDKLLQMMRYFGQEELVRLGKEGAQGGLAERVRKLMGEASGYGMFGRLGVVVQILEGSARKEGKEGEAE